MSAPRLVPCLLLCALSACEAAPVASKSEASKSATHESASTPVAERPAEPAAPAAAERTFGAPLTQQTAVPVSEVLANPEPLLGKVVQCSGVVARVCERAGCWLELRAEGSPASEGLRVPMARHAFFIPQDAVGRPAIVEGELSARELGAGERAHLEGEGLKAIGPLSLSASGVVIR
ncbi:MAG: DUF4920 domain-containing protein [Myxococcales bacterium]